MGCSDIQISQAKLITKQNQSITITTKLQTKTIIIVSHVTNKRTKPKPSAPSSQTYHQTKLNHYEYHTTLKLSSNNFTYITHCINQVQICNHTNPLIFPFLRSTKILFTNHQQLMHPLFFSIWSTDSARYNTCDLVPLHGPRLPQPAFSLLLLCMIVRLGFGKAGGTVAAPTFFLNKIIN